MSTDVEETQAEKRLKIVVVGDTLVGKTSIVLKFCFDEFSRQYTPTGGIDFFLKNLSLGSYKNVNLHLWDISGHALRGNLLDTYIFGAHIILLVYDVTNNASFNSLHEWVSAIKGFIENNQENSNNPLIALIGNKCDMEHQRSVRRDRSHRFAAENALPCFDMSARTGESVSLCIANLAAQVLGVRLTRIDQDHHRPIVTAEIGESVDMSSVTRVTKRLPNKRQTNSLNDLSAQQSKNTACSLQ